MYDITENQMEDISSLFVTPEILNEIILDDYPYLRLGPSVSQVIMLLVNGFIEDTIKGSYSISKMQGRVEVLPEDVLIHLKRKYLNTCFCEFCDLQQSEIDLIDSNSLDSDVSCYLSNNRISSLTNFSTERLRANEDRRLSQRLKQINIAKNTIGYERYIRAVGKHERYREFNLSWHPSTPDVTLKISKSCFTGRLREWKLRLHLWGNLEEQEYNYIIDNNLKLPPSISMEKSKLYNKACMEEGIIECIDTEQTMCRDIENLKFSELRVSPINFTEKDSVLDMLKMKNRFQTQGARISQIHSETLSNSILIPEEGVFKYNSCITLFIPDSYRGMQVWKSCNFLRHRDILSAARINSNIFIECKIPISEFKKRHNLDFCVKFGQNSQDSNTKVLSYLGEGKNYGIKVNELLNRKSSADVYRLINLPIIVRHYSKKPLLFNCLTSKQRNRNLSSLPCYYPSSIVYCSILRNLSLPYYS
ncbi:hypothetical protein RS030_152351 [Cryptosporidium xiaoi]|uniref:Histone RNA hairpin-binding protein RNA-binding domain-containing protein n=1 Tax=Cryptosporidium xiaoi TaxID=659607 RepID=A0AAV9Y0I0_9CRYT